MNSYDVIVVGAGAAGMMCAAAAGKRGRHVVLLDHSRKIGRKILISGGGRCNFTNLHVQPGTFVSENVHFCKSALSRYTPDDFIGLVKKHRIAFHEKKLGQLFCDESAEHIVNMLVDECEQVKAHFRLGCEVVSVSKENRFLVETNQGQFTSDSLVIATGGLSIPYIGATGFGYKLAEQFGLKIVKTAPALDGFVFSAEDLKRYGDLPGVSLDTVVTCNEASFRENILFTHAGLSGPASLQASLYWHKGQSLAIDLLPDVDVEQQLLALRREGSRIELKNMLSDYLPRRFAERFCELFRRSVPLNQLAEPTLQALAQQLHNWPLVPGGTVGYKKAEVTRGGVSTDELSSKTMEAKKVPGLYFIGEVVDVTGWLGGYNFQWAWASGHAAGQFV